MSMMTGEVLEFVVTVAEESKAEKGGGDLVIDVGGGEEVCRICHLVREAGRGTTKGSEKIWIGCGCKGELGFAHRDCGEAWFRVKGNRYCEICGMNAKNINGEVDCSFMEEWHEGRMMEVDGTMIAHLNENERARCWRSRPFCSFLLGCLIIAFILPWFFRVKLI